MLYVFHVDTGTMMTFDMKLAMSSVANLQHAIAMEYPIPEEKQVLLISGGESLDPAAVVGKYHAGTDTNPIFLFSKSTIEAQHPPSPSVHYGSDVDIQSQVEGSLLMPPAYGTVVSRAQLALQIHEVDKEEIKACKQLVHDQHLQQQGWAAVVANLEDITSALRHRSEIFTDSYNEYLIPRDDYLKTLSSVEHSLQLLSKIPVLPCLLQQSTELYDKSSSSSSGSSTSSKSLFDWISSQDPSHSLHDMVVKCIKATEQLDERVLTTLNKDVQDMFVQVDNPSMKEVKGIEDRLYGLDQILSSAAKVVQEQGDMAQGFVQNQNRVSTLKDKSILPDLCSSHKKQLLVMVQNHKKIQETKKKCKMAKEELAVNLHARLRWVMLVEKRICDVDGKLIIYHENLKRLRKRLEVLKQIHDAPDIYAQLVVEVVRRRKFSGTFSEWASSIADESTQIHSEEYKRREAFLNHVGRHFLHTLFSGLEPFSSTFAMDPPAAVDQHLPEITEDDLEMLKTSVPELADKLVVTSDNSRVIKSHIELPTVTQTKPKIPKPSSLTTSEIEIIHSFEDRFYTAERAELSLGDQVASSELTSNLLTKSDIGVTSPTEKTEFIMPKSLSEELTKEMQEVSRKKISQSTLTSVHKDEVNRTAASSATGEASGTSSSSGDQIKSTESEISSHDRSTESSQSGKKKSIALCTSPDMETSQEFTTADFYIEDSMPSSIGGTPPSTKSVDKSTKPREQSVDSELKTVKGKLKLSEWKLQSMKEMVSNFLSELRQRCKDYGASIKQDRENLTGEFEMTKDKMKQVLQAYELNLKVMHNTLEENFQKEISDLQKQNLQMEVLLTETKQNFNVEHEKVQQKSGTLEKQIADLTQTLRSEKLEKNELETEIKNLKEHIELSGSEFSEKLKEMEIKYEEMETNLKGELQELSKQHSLEMEVELDKIRSDFEIQVCQLELEVKGHETKSEQLMKDLAAAEKSKVKLEETLATEYQSEKDSIKQILTEEFNEKITKEREKNSLREKEIRNDIQKSFDTKLDEVKADMTKKKETEVERVREELSIEFDKTLLGVQQKYESEKLSLENMQIEKLKELENRHSKDLMKLTEEFNKCKQDLAGQLLVYTGRKFNVQEIQTEKIVQMECAIQTEVPSHVSASLQTEPEVSLMDSHCQTEWQGTNVDTQTETIFKSTEIQTDQQNTSFGTTQTDLREVIQVEMQTDSWVGVVGVCSTEVEEKGVQTSLDIVETHAQTDVTETKDQQSQIVDDSTQKMIQEMQEKHQKEINDLITRLEKDKEDSCLSLKTSLIAERQVSFNEAVNKVSSGKDAIITELREKQSEDQERLKAAQDSIDKLTEEKNKIEDIKTRALAHLSDKEREFGACKRSFEDEIAMLKQQLQHQQQIQSMSVSSAPSVMEISSVEESRTKLSLLEEEVKQKDEELARMQQKLSDLTMTASMRTVVQDKVSITSCNVGDLALFCLDERHDQYVVFTIGSTLHFLHSDCVQPLGLEPAPGENRKSWVLAEITDKEYCQAKKAQNRFKVPLGTKFYRVKAKQWSRETSAKKSDTAPGSS